MAHFYKKRKFVKFGLHHFAAVAKPIESNFLVFLVTSSFFGTFVHMTTTV